MKRSHLAAMLLAGWYLMIPPPRVVTDRFEINFSAPIQKWVQLRRFDSTAECEAARRFYAKKPEGLTDMLGGREQAVAAMGAAKCISTDDPRLKEN